MPPLILHNVPDDELYTGDDGIQRPYAMLFPDRGDRQRDAPRRRAVAESGSFGKSTRRSRSRTGSAPPRREDPTMQAADRLFAGYVASQEQTSSSNNNAATGNSSGSRKTSYLSQATAADDSPTGAGGAVPGQPSHFEKEPTEVILRGYKSVSQQYAAIYHYENLAGRICEDYSREPPLEQRRYKSDLRDSAYTRRQILTPQERAKVNQVAAGCHWVKVTFESAEGADAAISASPQDIQGYLVYAEHYRGVPPVEDAAIVQMLGHNSTMLQDDQPQFSSSFHHRRRASERQQQARPANLPALFAGPNGRASGSDFPFETNYSDSPPVSFSSSNTLDTATLSNNTNTTTTLSSATMTQGLSSNTTVTPHPNPFPSEPTATSATASTTGADGVYCRRYIPSAKRAELKPAELALLPQPGLVARIVACIPLVRWFGGSMIGNEVPRTDAGEFDYARASLYWRLMWFLDYWFGLFGGEIGGCDKED